MPIAGFVGWASYHLFTAALAFTGHRVNHLATAWAVGFLILWWVPLSWFERAAGAPTQREQRRLDKLKVAVQIPMFNEDAAAFRACLESVLAQYRRPDRVLVVDDGSEDPHDDIREWFTQACGGAGIDLLWLVQPNQGKRHAQVAAFRHDDSDILVTLDSDSILDRNAIGEGLKPFTDRGVMSVGGLVAVLNTKATWLTYLTSMLYVPFTRGARSAQSVLGSVLVNSGTLAFYRGWVIRKFLGVYENETFCGTPMQMNDDSMLTFYAGLHGRTVHQPSSVAYTLVPERFGQYRKQQMRWMRGTMVRTFWWFRYSRHVWSPMFWMPFLDLCQMVMTFAVPVVLFMQPWARANAGTIGISSLLVAAGINWMISFRFLMLSRSDEPLWFQVVLILLVSPLASLWRLFVVRPMYYYSICTLWRIGSWGTRAQGVEVGLS